VLVGTLTMLAVAQVDRSFRRRLEQRDSPPRSEEPKPQSAPVFGDGYGRVIALYVACNVIYLKHPAAGWQSYGADHSGARHQSTPRRPRGHGVMSRCWARQAERCGDRHHAVYIWLLQWPDSGGFACYYAMAKTDYFSKNVAQLHPPTRTPAVFAHGANGVVTCTCASLAVMDNCSITLLRRAGFYVLTIFGLFVLRRTRPSGTPLSGDWLPGASAIYIVMAYLSMSTIALQTAVHLAGLIIVLLGIPVYSCGRAKCA